MKTRSFQIVVAILILCMAVLACAKFNPTTTLPQTTAPTPDGSGPKTIAGTLTYTNTFFTAGVAQPVIILEDQGGFVTRNRKFLIPVESQVIGEITSDYYTSPFTYSLSLPSKPNGTLHDVDHDGQKETGVMIFAVAYWTNTWGDPYLERRDQFGGGWSGAYASTKVSDDPNSYLEVYGGKYLVYAPDGEQQFPSGFGADKKLFTDDDPIMDLAAGWSVINMDQSPFGVDRSESPSIELIEPEGAALVDFSGLSYTEAFDGMAEKFKNEYAFTELKKIDWDAKAAEFRPRFEEAEKNNDKHAYALALRDYLWSIPDTHVGSDVLSMLSEDFQTAGEGGLGFAVSETDDGKIVATFITQNGPAAIAGMKWGAEIISMDGVPTSTVVDKAIPWSSSSFSNPVIKRLQQLPYATRFKMDKGQVEVKFKNIGGNEQTVALDVVNEVDSFNIPSARSGISPTALPVEFDVLPSGYGYIKISSFLDNTILSIQVWERAIQYFNDNQVPGVILDLRNNGGGDSWLADQMAAYFFDKEIVVGSFATYSKDTGQFYSDPDRKSIMIPPRTELQYSGPVVVMVGPNCASACEFFSYNMTINDRAAIVGQYPSEGAGGGVEDFKMPEDITVRMTVGRKVDANGNIHIEGKGVVPTVRVPVTLDTLKKEANGVDVVLAVAEKAISQR